MINKNISLPLYSQLIDILMEKVINVLGENEQIPSEREICETYNVSRTTVRQALLTLESEGYIYKVHGKGTFTSTKQYFPQIVKGIYSFTEDMKMIGKAPSSKVIKFSKKNPTKDICTRLNISKDVNVYNFIRIRLGDNEPFIVENTVIPEDLFLNFSKEWLENYPLYEILLNKYSQRVEYAEEIVSPVISNSFESKNLNITVNSPCLKIVRYAHNKGNRIIEYTVGIARGDKFKYKLYLSR